ncbi:hypothetical protein [Limosilactobacillus pontis]|uniref:hypothetical protein n=1 Tax=Limosilactobacillus pontis TaxID=35787 RepID=UPI002F265A09
MATLWLTQSIGNKDFNRNDITFATATMKDGRKQRIEAYEIDKLADDQYVQNVKDLIVHTSDHMMHSFDMSEWLVKEAE